LSTKFEKLLEGCNVRQALTD